MSVAVSHSNHIFSVFISVFVSLFVHSLELPVPQEPILTQPNNLVVVCHHHVHYFFEGSCRVIEGTHRAGDLKVLVHFQGGEETLIISDKDPVLAAKLEGLDVGHRSL